jgi:hypothetical protein
MPTKWSRSENNRMRNSSLINIQDLNDLNLNNSGSNGVGAGKLTKASQKPNGERTLEASGEQIIVGEKHHT